MLSILYACQSDELDRLARKFRGLASVTVIHGETCPRCQRKRVNLYKQSDKEWLCRQCAEQADAVEEAAPEEEAANWMQNKACRDAVLKTFREKNTNAENN